MTKIREFFKKYPILFAVLGLVTIVTAVTFVPRLIVPYIPGALELGIRETVAAVIVLLVYFIAAGKRDFKVSFKGLGYGFRITLYLFIIYGVFVVGGIIKLVFDLKSASNVSDVMLSLLNILLTCFFVGIVEEFSFRAMVFGGLASAFGRTKKGVLWAAIVSGFLFGFIHVSTQVFTGQISSATEVMQVIGKTLQAGVFGFAIALIYFRTRNIWVVAVLHSLNDFVLFISDVSGSSAVPSYVKSAQNSVAFFSIFAYVFFALVLVPMVIRTVKELNAEEEPLVLPMDDIFVPRKVKYEKKTKETK